MNALFVLTVVVWAISAISLIVLVMLHSGKGTGLSETFGGGMQTSVGTGIIEKNLDRITIASASVFLISLIVLMVIWPRG